MNRISTIQGHGQPGCRRADRGGAAAHSMAALLKRVFIFIALMLTTASGAWAQGISDEAPAKQLYAEVSGTAMTLKYGPLPASGATAYDATNASWSDTFCSNITTATVDASCQSYTGTSLAYLFFNMTKLTTINGLTNLNTANVTAMTAMFYFCQALTSLDLSGFNTEKVTNMALMFYNCSALTSLDLSSFNTANVTRMQQMFNKCPALTSLDLSSFNTANVTIMNAMFQGCSALTAITVGDGWDTNKVTQSSNMFNGCTNLPNFDANTVDKTNAHTGTGGYLTAAAPALQPYYVTLAEGTEDAENWTITPNEGLNGGETVTIQYNGTRRIKRVTAVQTAAAEEQQEEAVTAATPLTMECLTDGTIKVNIGGTLSSGMQYAVNGGTKTKITTTTTIEDLKAGDKVQFYGVGTSTQVYGGDVAVSISGGTAQVKVYGNIMSLLDETGFATKTDLPSDQYVFYGLFSGNGKLTDASGLLLPATTLAKNCYQGMFYGCTALTAAPELPAMTLTERCYAQMFYGCSVLTAAPELPATTLVKYCYYSMFTGCSKLASVTCKATDISADYCLNNWLNNAGTQADSPTLYVDPSMTSNTGWNNREFFVTAITAGGSEPEAATYTMAADAAAGDVGKLICTDGHIHAYNADADCTKSRVAMIAYVGNASDCTNGLAIALADESGKKTWSAAGTACSGKTAVTDGTWRLPSIKDWQYMFIGCGASESYSDSPSSMSYSKLATKLTTANGTALQTDDYWSSSEYIPGTAWQLRIDGGSADFGLEGEDDSYYVRACLAF